MSDKKEQQEEIDFISKSSLQTAVKKSKRKQLIKYIGISIITTFVMIYVLINGSQYLLNKKLEAQDGEFMYDSIHGANLSSGGGSYNYSLFSVTMYETIKKTVGDRSIVWDKTLTKIPIFGRKEVLERGSGFVEAYSTNTNNEYKRVVRYNDYNNERKLDFYYPKLSYDYLPHEIDIAASLDDNKLIEVGLSFTKPLSIKELQKILGHKNVNWLWVDTSYSAQMERMTKELPSDDLKTKGGGGAFGFDVYSETSYSQQQIDYFNQALKQLAEKKIHKNEVKEAIKGINENTHSNPANLKFNGAVVTGTAKELKRFQNMDIIRASVLGATIDKY